METKKIIYAKAFGMSRCRLGYITKEQLAFVLSDNEEKNLKTISDFAKKHGCNIVEVWTEEDTKWGEVKFYKIYNFYSPIKTETFEKLDIYKK